MKTFRGRLRDRTAGELIDMIARQVSQIEISKRDLGIMREVLAEKEAKP
jgi:hypothetical protein